MSIAFVGSQAEGWNGDPGPTQVDFALSGGLASTPAAGDFVLVTYSVGAQNDRTLSILDQSEADYTLVGSELFQASYARSNLRMAYKFMGGTPDTYALFAGADWSYGSAVAIEVFRGVDSTNPLDVAAVTAGAAGSRIVNASSITPTTSGAVIVVAGGAGTLSGTSGTYTSSELSGFVTANGTDNYDAMVGAGHYVWTSGAFDPAAFGGGGTDSTDDAWTAITIALRPASSGSTTIDCSIGNAVASGSAATLSASLPCSVGNTVVNGVQATITIDSSITIGCSAGDSVADGVLCLIDVTPVQGEKVGGDDAYHHTGWDKKAWQKKQKREEAIEETIRETYQKMMGVAPSVEVVESVAQEVKKEAPAVIQKPATFDYSGVAEWLQAQEAIIAQIIAKRQEDDDEEAILLLL